jgi:hypothetical protein
MLYKKFKAAEPAVVIAYFMGLESGRGWDWETVRWPGIRGCPLWKRGGGGGGQVGRGWMEKGHFKFTSNDVKVLIWRFYDTAKS